MFHSPEDVSDLYFMILKQPFLNTTSGLDAWGSQSYIAI